jgi:TonB family protein
MHAKKNLKGHRFWRGGMLQLVAIVVLLGFAIQGRAGEGRAVKSRVAPIYPELARRMKIMGVVEIEAIVDAGGRVVDVRTVSGSRTLSPAAEDAVRKWKFVPAAGQTTANVDVNFQLSK